MGAARERGAGGARAPRRWRRGRQGAVSRFARVVRYNAVMQALVGIIMGSATDWETMQAAAAQLDKLNVAYEVRVVSAHRTPDLLFEYASGARARGLEVLIAGAGGAAHLPGMTAAKTTLPVLAYRCSQKRSADLIRCCPSCRCPPESRWRPSRLDLRGRRTRRCARPRSLPTSTRMSPRRSQLFATPRRRASSAIPIRARTRAHDRRHCGRRPARPHAGVGRLPPGPG